jgi:hypothetical protein
VSHVDLTDTVVAIAGHGPMRPLTDIVRIVVDTPAVLLAVATHRSPLLLRRRCRHHGPVDRRNGVHGEGSAEEVFDLMSLVAIHAIRWDQARWCSRDSPL